MSDIAMSVTMDEKDVQRALQAMVKENAKLRAEIGLGVQESKAAAAQEREWQKLREKATKDATQQMQQLNNAAQRIKDSVATPFEEAKKKANELREHLQAGRITVDEYRKAYAAVGKEMKEASRDHAAEAEAAKAAAAAKAEASRLAAESEREHSQAVREATAIADKYATKEERVAAELKRLNTLKEKGVLSSKDYARAVEAEQKKLSETGDAADKSGGLIGGLTTKMGGFVAGLASASGVVAILKQEYDALIERQGKSADANISLAAEQESLLGNLGDADPKKLFESISKISDDTSIKEENVTRAINEAMAARADLALQDVLDGVSTAAKVRKFAPSELAGLSAAAIDTRKQTGLDMDQSMGFLMQMLPQSRVKSLKGVAENFTPAVGGLMQQGADRSTAAALLASLSHGMGDVTGQQTRTAGLSLGGQLRAFAPGQDMATTIAMLQQDKEQREKFLSKASFEVAARPAIESLLTGGKQADQFAAARAAFQEDPRMALERGVKARDASAAIGLAETNQAFGNVTDQQRLGDKRAAESGIVRKQLDEFREAMGDGYFTRTIKGLFDDGRTGGVQTYDSAIRSIESDISEKQKSINYRSNLAPGGDREFRSNPEMAAAQKRDQEMVSAMREMIVLLKSQRDLQQRSEAENAEKKPEGIMRPPAVPVAPQGKLPAGNVRPPKRESTAAEQEYYDAVNDLRHGTTRARRERITNAEQALAVQMPPEYKTAMDHQTAVLERIAAQGEQSNHAGRVAARAQEGRP